MTNKNNNVEVLDSVANNLTVSDILSKIHLQNYDYIGLNIFSPNYLLVKKIVESINENNKIIIGGPITKYVYKDIIGWKTANNIVVIIGEGEFIVTDIINNSIKELPIYSTVNRQVFEITRKSCYYPEDLSIMMLNRSFVDTGNYINKYGLIERSMITSRGCIYNCAFCGAARSYNYDSSVREMSECTLRLEIDNIIKYNGKRIQCIRVLDDLFIKNRSGIERAIRVFNNYDIKWRAMAHINSIINNCGYIIALKESGCVELSIGIESGDDDIRRKINKSGTEKDVIKCIEYILSLGINVKGYFIYGFPDETKHQMNKTYDLAKYLSLFSRDKAGIFKTSTFQYRPYHGTKLYKYIVNKYGTIGEYIYNKDLEKLKGRNQFNFKNSNYSMCSDEFINSIIISTDMLNEKLPC